MARLKGVSDRDAGLGAKIAFFFTKRKLAQMTGLETAGMLEPLRMYAHIPRLLGAIGKLEQAESKLDILSPRHRALAELKAATTVRCEYCIDLGSQIARTWGITDEELLGMADYQPLTQGISAALPYLDVFAPAHNLESLLLLEHHLEETRGHARAVGRRLDALGASGSLLGATGNHMSALRRRRGSGLRAGVCSVVPDMRGFLSTPPPRVARRARARRPCARREGSGAEQRSGGVDRRVATDAQGRYSIRLRRGTYTVRVSPPQRWELPPPSRLTKFP